MKNPVMYMKRTSDYRNPDITLNSMADIVIHQQNYTFKGFEGTWLY